MMSPSSSSLGTDVVNESSVVNTTTTRLTDVNATENYITINLIGRLGNRMFQYASFMGLARRTRRTPVLICERLLAPKYPRIAAECLPQAMAKPFGELPKRNKLTIHEVQNVTSVTDKVVKAKQKHIRISGYFQSFRYFQNIFGIIGQRFQFGTKVMGLAEKFMLSMTMQYKRNANVTGDVTPIAVHVRRGDYLSKRAIASGRQVATTDYLYATMNYFRKRYTNCLFLVASNDAKWCREHLLARDVMLIADHMFNSTAKFADDVERDVSVLRLVEHSILSTGTFSWWIGWFTPGEVVYYKKPRARRKSLIPANLSHWRGML